MKNEIIYNKLIRDRIPEIIKVDGWVSKTRVMEKDEFIKELKKQKS
jgi:predicted house-cleaning noncanonical NTP pyrophosphatase (MazG superfamily)